MEKLATWNEARDAWEVDQGDLLSGHLDVFSETWPRSGSMRNGTAYVSPTSAAATDDSACSYLPTPTTRDYKDNRIRREPHRPDSTDTLSRALSDLI